jgi:hypothetical protein
MMRIATAILLASVSLAALGQAAAADTTQTGAQIRVVPYSPLLRTEIVGVIGQPTTITFPLGESVYRVVQTGKPNKDGALADAGWQGAAPSEIKDTPLGNNLTLWPVMPGESTMTVITMSSAGAQKVYPFRLLARPDADGAADASGVVLNLIFKGGVTIAPGAPMTARSAGVVRTRATRHSVSTVAQMAAEEQLRTDAFNGADGSCHYLAKGRRPTPIQPRCPLNNGQWTLMRFPGLSEKPAVYVVGTTAANGWPGSTAPVILSWSKRSQRTSGCGSGRQCSTSSTLLTTRPASPRAPGRRRRRFSATFCRRKPDERVSRERRMGGRRAGATADLAAPELAAGRARGRSAAGLPLHPRQAPARAGSAEGRRAVHRRGCAVSGGKGRRACVIADNDHAGADTDLGTADHDGPPRTAAGGWGAGSPGDAVLRRAA